VQKGKADFGYCGIHVLMFGQIIIVAMMNNSLRTAAYVAVAFTLVSFTLHDPT
jgi:hypothetical protein